MNRSDTRKKHILIAVVGMTPQVVTETLYALMVQRTIPIAEVFIITTTAGRESVQRAPGVAQQMAALCQRYHLRQPEFDLERNVLVAREESVELFDIRSDRDNVLFPNVITDFIRKHTDDQRTVIHCSIAGGRKTMSVAAAFALSLFGRANDKLYHVLVSKEFEDARKYFPDHPDEDKHLVLSEIPYIRLREKLPLLREHPRALYSELVAIAQERIDEMEHLPPLIFETTTRSVRIGAKRIQFQPFDFAFYLFVAQQQRPVLGGKRFSDANLKRLQQVYEKYSPSAGHIERVRKTISSTEKHQRLTKSGSVIRQKLRSVLGEHFANYYAVASEGLYANVHYRILLDKKKIRLE